MPITSGVHRLNAAVTIDGRRIDILSGGADQEATRKSSTMHALCALKDFGGDRVFASLASLNGSLIVNGTTLVDGVWDTASIDYDDQVVRLSGRDKSAALHENKPSEKFNNKKRSEVIELIAKRNGLQVKIDGGILHAGKKFQIDWAMLAHGISDASIIHQIAELEGARWWVKGSTLYFSSKSSQGSSYPVIFQAGGSGPNAGNFIRLRASINLQAAKTLKVLVNGWHTKKKKVISSSKSLNGVGGTLTYNYRTPGVEQDHADDLALRKLAEHSRHELTLDIHMVGDTSIDIGMGLQLLGTAFDQTYDIDSIHHQIGQDGYTMAIRAKAARQGRSAS